jgi:hypothetical protein
MLSLRSIWFARHCDNRENSHEPRERQPNGVRIESRNAEQDTMGGHRGEQERLLLALPIFDLSLIKTELESPATYA